ncbi:SRPBCC family protein [Flavivirga algicola]|uniref:SRPBCC family protein n=1 Tax=Flavivirga algicola TaxID=2729136 RepID=A0ABX1RZP2_9FLAO|nr:SRPBCC family protein [Flavivirga algicola]NMH89069.1 SRPBCC family protein [Flavivirga algicola]
MTKLTAPLQLDQQIIINATPEKVWTVFNDQSLLTKWTQDVQYSQFEQKMAAPGQLRKNECIVNGKKGTIETRCVSMTGQERAEFIVEKDTFGMTKMLQNMSFAAEFHSLDSNKTKFVMKSHYKPKNFLLNLMNGFIKKKMGKEVDIMLIGLKNYIEKGAVNKLNPINQ